MEEEEKPDHSLDDLPFDSNSTNTELPTDLLHHSNDINLIQDVYEGVQSSSPTLDCKGAVDTSPVDQREDILLSGTKQDGLQYTSDSDGSTNDSNANDSNVNDSNANDSNASDDDMIDIRLTTAFKQFVIMNV